MAKSILRSLSKVIRKEMPGLPAESRVQKEMEELEKDVARLKAYLMEVVVPPNSYNTGVGEAAYNQERKIRAFIYDAEDILDSYKAQIALHEFSSSIFPKSILDPKFNRLFKHAKSIRSGNNLINPDLIHIDQASSTAAENQPASQKRRIHKPPSQDNVVAFEEETKTLVHNLLEKSWKLDVISITGMTGCGKTTLASKIYHDRRIQKMFRNIIWVHVSQVFNKKDVFLTILEKFTQQDMSRKTVKQLGLMITKYLDGMKFLIFMDDICTVEAWEEIRASLPMHNKYGKILITSSNKHVALYENKFQIDGRLPIELQLLEESKCWELLQLRVYGKLDRNITRKFKKVGRLIVKQCGRLPGALAVIGDILAKKVSHLTRNAAMEIWEDVSKNVKLILFDTDNPERKETIISSCYNRLPCSLRDCFLYLGMFPENFEIPTWKLIQLWIAEGYIRDGEGRTMEEIARENLMELIMRNLVEVDQQKTNGYPKTCRVNTTVREFCIYEAAAQRKSIFCELTRPNCRMFQEMENNRRLCIHSNVGEFLLGKPKLPKTHSFLCFSEESFEGNQSIAGPFKMLRVLEANTIRFPKIPAKLTNLVHLKYIALSSNTLHVLPKAISKLWNIHSIIVNTLSPTLEIEADIWKMEQIRLVKTNAAIALKKNGKGTRGQNLQKLTRLSPESCTDQVFTLAKNLKTLGIRGQLSKLLDSNFLEKLDSLESLKLEHTVEHKLPLPEHALQKLPPSHAFPRNLKILTVSSTFLNWGNMSILGDLLCLQVLKLKDHAFVGNRWDTKDGGFIHLECLSIDRTNLKKWYASSKSFPNLRILLLENCEKLERVPLELGNKLVKLEMRGVSRSVVGSGTEIEAAKLQKSPRDGFKLVLDTLIRSNAPKCLTMLPGSFYIPKKNNASIPAGQDAHFIDSAAQVIGVADGVGGWSREGIDSGEYSRALMKNAAKSESIRESKLYGGTVDPKEVLHEAFMKTVESGSSTCCIVSLDDNLLCAVNVGDSGFVVIRGGKVIYRSPVQQHGFNCPYQMGYGRFSKDVPEVADEIEFPLEDGDVLVVATDGLFDNVFHDDIQTMAIRCLAEGKPSHVLARMLATMAVEKSLDKGMKSPFELAAREAGVEHSGGKYDDVTVIAAYVTSV